MSLIGRILIASVLGIQIAPIASAEPFNASLGGFGTVGIIDMPNALMQNDGQTSWSFLDNGTSSGATFDFQLLPWLQQAVENVVAQAIEQLCSD